MQLPEDLIKSFVEQIGKTKEKELPCDDVFELLDEYTEAAARGEDTSSLLPYVQHHLEICRDCLEEYEALLRILKAEEEGA